MRSLLEGESGEWRVQQRYRDCASNLKHVTSCSFSIVFFFTACLQNLDVRHFCKKKIWVNPANSVDSFFCNCSLVHCVALSMPEIPALDIPPACQNHQIQHPPLNSFSHSFIPRNVFAPQIEKQRI